MLKSILLLFTCLTLLCGCARNYVLTLSNGRRITTASKPHLQNGRYVFKDAAGRQVSVPEGQVREVAPASMAKEETSIFQPSKK